MITAPSIDIQKAGYLELINACAGGSKKDSLVDLINNLENYNGDKDYMTTLNYVMSHLDQENIHFIMSLDWKQEVRDLNWRINSALRDNFDLAIELPDPAKYGSNASVSCKNVFREYDKALREKDFQLSFIDTNSDEYVIVVHKTKDEPVVKAAARKIGYDCLNANSPKINNEI